MSKQLERAEARVEKLRKEADIKRLKAAKGYFDAGLALIKDPFHDQEIQGIASEMFDVTDSTRADMEEFLKRNP